jgi:hypothetical protein
MLATEATVQGLVSQTGFHHTVGPMMIFQEREAYLSDARMNRCQIVEYSAKAVHESQHEESVGNYEKGICASE